MKKFFITFKNKCKKLFNFNGFVCLCGILILLMFSILFGYSITSGNLVLASGKTNVSSYYLIEADCTNDYNTALEIASQVQEKGGAGYIRFDEGYHIFISAYLTEKDAKSVMNKVGGASIYALNLSEFDFNNGFSQNVNQIFKNNIICFKYSLENLNKLITQFDKGEINISQLKSNCLLIIEEIDIQIEKFEDIFYQDSTMYKYKNYMLEFKSNFNSILDLDNENTEFSRTVKYLEISNMFCFKKILDLI